MTNRVAPRGTTWVWLLGLMLGICSGALVVYVLAAPSGASVSAEVSAAKG